MENLFLKLLNMSFTGCFIILGMMLLRPLLKKAPKWITLCLWGVVALRLICPISFESFLSLVPSKEPIPMNIATSTTPEVDVGSDFLNAPINSLISENLAPEVGASVNPMQILIFIGTVVWLFGMVTFVLISIIKYIKLHKKVMASVLFQDNIYLCDNIKSSFILGVFKAKIFIPSNLNPQEMEFVVAHERSHIHHMDHILKPFGFIILMLHWFNPLVWISYTLFCKDIEFACDERVIKPMSTDDKRDYSKTLLSLSVPTKMFFADPLAFGEVSVKSRIKSVLSYKKPTLWAIIIAVILSVVLCILFLGDPPVEGEAYIPLENSTNCEGVTVKLEEIDPLSDSPTLTVKIINKTGKELSYGERFDIFRIENGKKVDCFTGDEKIWHEILNLLQGENGTHTVSIKDYDISKAGVYSFEFNFTVGNEAMDKYLARVEFAIDYEETAEVFKASYIAYDKNRLTGYATGEATMNPGELYYKIENNKLYQSSSINPQVNTELSDSTPVISGANGLFWQELGTTEETTLTKENFDDYFNPDCWFLKYSAQGFRNSAEKVWKVKCKNSSSYRIVKYDSGKYLITVETENFDGVYKLYLLNYVDEIPTKPVASEVSKNPEVSAPTEETAEVFKTSAIAYAPSEFYGIFIVPPTVPEKPIICLKNGKLYINSESIGTGRNAKKGENLESTMSSLYASVDDQVTWKEVGNLTETTLTDENFYNYLSPNVWLNNNQTPPKKYSVSAFKNKTQKSWQAEGDDGVYYRLAQGENNHYFLTIEKTGKDNKPFIHYLIILKKV